MSSAIPSRPRLSAAEFLALHRQLAALVRLGLPLERLLGRWNIGGTRRWKEHVRRIGEALERGASLEEALQEVQNELAPAYQAMLRMGHESGNPGAALDAMARFGERAVAVRNQLVLSLGYPVVVSLISLGVVVAFLAILYPLLTELVSEWNGTLMGIFTVLSVCRSTMPYWAPPAAAVPVVVFLWWSLLTRRSRILVPSVALGRLGWFPGVRRLLRSQQTAVFLELLVTAVRQGVPVDLAIRLAGEVLGDRAWASEAADLAEQIASQNWKTALETGKSSKIPSPIRWTIVDGIGSPQLPEVLRGLAEEWYRRCEREALVFRSVIVPAVILAISVSCVSIVLVVFWVPWWQALFQLASFRI